MGKGMGKIIVFAATLLIFALSSCEKGEEPIRTRDLCLYSNTSKYDIMFGKPQVISIHSGKQLEIDGFNKQSLDTMYMNLNLYYGDMANVDGEIIKIEGYAWPASSVEEVKGNGILTRTHRFEFTDALLDDIKVKMAEKGIKPEKGAWTSDF